MSLVDLGRKPMSPPDFILNAHLPFKYGVYEHVRAPGGRFSVAYEHYAFMAMFKTAVGTISLNGKQHSSTVWPAASYSIFRPNDRLEGSFDHPADYQILHLCPVLIDALIASEVGHSHAFLATTLRTEMPPVIQSIWGRLQLSVHSKAPTASSIAELCVELMVVKLLEEQVGPPNTTGAGSQLAAVRRAVDYIEANLGDKLDLKSIAEQAGLSTFYFCRVFRATYGTTVHRFILERRLQMAWSLLASTDQSISRIALDCGFSSQSHLTTSFRQRYSVTPAAFRQLAGLNPRL